MLTFEQKAKIHKELLEEIHKLYLSKNKDYGDSVHDTFLKYGMSAYLVRVEDKINRINNLTKNGFEPCVDEKLKDNLLDAANYLILAAIELEDDKSERVTTARDFSKSVTFLKSDALTTPTTSKISSIMVDNGHIVSYDEHEEQTKEMEGIHVYESGPNLK